MAASYALDQTNKWVYGFVASFILGLGHLISSIAMVGVFFYAKEYFNRTQVNEPITVDLFSTTISIGGPVALVAGVLLITLGIREYVHDHSHGYDHEHSHDHGEVGLLERVKGVIPFVGGHSHSHDDGHQAAERGLFGIAWFAFVLGFAHEEEFERCVPGRTIVLS
ncbi:hypothetical protein U3A55_04735 [Salarchaeum sp. III]